MTPDVGCNLNHQQHQHDQSPCQGLLPLYRPRQRLHIFSIADIAAIANGRLSIYTDTLVSLVRGASDESVNFDFSTGGDTYMIENIKFIWDAFTVRLAGIINRSRINSRKIDEIGESADGLYP